MCLAYPIERNRVGKSLLYQHGVEANTTQRVREGVGGTIVTDSDGRDAEAVFLISPKTHDEANCFARVHQRLQALARLHAVGTRTLVVVVKLVRVKLVKPHLHIFQGSTPREQNVGGTAQTTRRVGAVTHQVHRHVGRHVGKERVTALGVRANDAALLESL